MNLLINAIHAMGATPPEFRFIEVRTCAEAEVITVVIRDYGHGIPAERLPTVFDPFFSSKVNGLGMGLSICRRIIESHGGRIIAENPADGGANFRFALPATGHAVR